MRQQAKLSLPYQNPAVWYDSEMYVWSVQGAYESRTIFDSLDIAWGLLRIFPRELLRRITAKTLDTYYDKESKHE